MKRKVKKLKPKFKKPPIPRIGLGIAFRSGLEESIARELHHYKVSFKYEPFQIPYIRPVTCHSYTPDFILDNGIIIESKGHFTSDDRKKHILIKEQYPELDIRFVFGNPNNKFSKTSNTTYAKWCEKHGFIYAARTIPLSWAKEPDKILPEFIRKRYSKDSGNR